MLLTGYRKIALVLLYGRHGTRRKLSVKGSKTRLFVGPTEMSQDLPPRRLNKEGPSVRIPQDGGERDKDVTNNVDVKRVIKEISITSTTFIGPALPPGLAAAKTDVERSLSEFYKELQEIDAHNASHSETLDSSAARKETPPGKGSDLRELKEHSRAHRKTSEEKQPLRSYSLQNAPYTARRPPADHPDGACKTPQSWRHPRPLNGTTKFRPDVYDLPPVPKPPPFMLNHFGPPNTSQYPPSYPPPPRFPPPDVSHSPRGFYDDAPRHFDVYEDAGGREDDGHRHHQDFDSENDIWERRHHSPPPWSRVLILMRGLPGSGKSTLARELCSGPSGLVLSTDDYFENRGGYDVQLLGTAHKWNQDRASEAMLEGRTPIIIDNTNVQSWEMKPYVQMALHHRYQVDFCEPNTSWKFDPRELEKRNKHGVDQVKIAQMLERFSFPISVDIIMESQEPQRVRRRQEPGRPRRSPDYYDH